MNPLARRRIAAYALDVIGYLGIAAATVPVGVLALRAGLGGSRPFVLTVSAVPVAIAVAVGARAEARGSTWGKRRFGLRVESRDGSPLSGARAFARNVVKIAIPWQLGHAVAIGAAFGGFDRPEPTLIGVAVGTYAVIGVGIWGVLRSSGITLHDVIAGSRVIDAVYAAPRCWDTVGG